MAEPGEISTLEAKPLLKRPGGAHIPRPVVINGKNFDPFDPPKLIRNADGTQRFIGGKEIDKDQDGDSSSEGVPGLDVSRLKGIYEKCVAKYEGKYPNGLLDISVVLDADDRIEVGKLIGMAKSAHAGFVAENPDWIKFVELRKKMRDAVGTFGEDARIIEDNSVQTPTEAQAEDNIPRIRVPTSIYRLSVWGSRIGLLDGSFGHYDRGNAEGQMASYLGNSIKEVYGFVKESHASSGQRQ